MELWNQSTMNAPWSVESRTKLAFSAVRFFNPLKYAESCAAIGKPASRSPEPFSITEFMTFLENNREFPKKPSVLRVVQILERMSSSGVLYNVGKKGGGPQFLSDCYLFFNTYSPESRGNGLFWLCSALGADFLYYLSASGVVHITGKDCRGDVRSGTGLVLNPYHIITCRHVVRDMCLDREQTFQGIKCLVDANAIHVHEKHDVAVIPVNTALNPLAGLVFQNPVIAQAVYTLGYPRIPCTTEAVLAMHSGAVTCESVVKFSGESLFLYSAISRPGNSGGPVISEDGYLVGISAEHLTMESDDVWSSAFSPHYAGVAAQSIISAVADMGLDVQIPFEDFE